jgi:hypothetical protein
LPDGNTALPEKLVVKTDLLRLMRLLTRGIFVMSIKNNGHEKNRLKLIKRQATPALLGNLSNFNHHLQMIF